MMSPETTSLQRQAMVKRAAKTRLRWIHIRYSHDVDSGTTKSHNTTA
jgi:hypothetical protein